jgi:DNA replication initiation complex subunit (GINS family)
MCDMVWDLVDEKHFNSKKYNKLKSEEKKLYDEIITLLRVEPQEVKGLRDHKRVTDKERDKCLKKLKILTGEIDSGNHSKKTMKELKVLLLKMIEAGYISKADSNRLLYRIMIVDE